MDKKERIYTRRTSPFPITQKRVDASPFQNINTVRSVLDKYHKKNGGGSSATTSIGFTYISSLKSMGLLPRANGSYVLGQKYRRL